MKTQKINFTQNDMVKFFDNYNSRGRTYSRNVKNITMSDSGNLTGEVAISKVKFLVLHVAEHDWLVYKVLE